MKSKIKMVLIAIVIIALGIVTFKYFSGMKKAPEPKKIFDATKYVISDRIEYSTHTAEITAYGRLKSYDKIEVYSEVSGNVMENNPRFKVGNYFALGKAMVVVDDEETRFNLYSQKSDFLNILTRMLPDIKADFPESFSIWNKYLEDFEIEKEMQVLPSIKSSKEKYFLAARNIYKLYYAIKNLEVRLSKYRIKAPFSGVVTQSMIETGTSVRIGQKLGEFSGTNNYELELSITVQEMNYVSLGCSVDVYLEGSDKHWRGSVVRISEHIDPTSQMKLVYVNLSGAGLSDGMYLKGVINGKDIDNSFEMPRKALVNNKFVFIVKDNVLEQIEVNVLKVNEKSILLKGPARSTIIVIEPLVNVPVGQKVKPVFKNENE
ncbi:MAG: HlyD family efflux transporter periplasmic adaptor subunit [bacterium]